MRPKKQILIVAGDETRASVLKFMLYTNGFAVEAVLTAADAEEQLPARPWDLVICELPLSGAEHLLDQACQIRDGIPSIVIAAKGAERPEGICSDAVLPRHYIPADLLERARVISRRKRGPKPAKKPPEAVPAIAGADRRLA